MNLLFIQPITNLTGCPISLQNHLRNIHSRYANLFVLVPDDGPIVERYRRLDAKILITPMHMLSKQLHLLRPYLLKFVPTMLRVMSVLRKNRIQLVHINSYCNLYGGVAARLMHIPVVWHVRGFPEAPKRFERIYMNTLNRLSTTVIFPASRTRDELFAQNGISFKKTVVVPNGVDLKTFNPRIDGSPIRRELGIGRNKRVVGVISHLGAPKGQHVLVQAARIVHEANTKAVFLLAGGCHIPEYLGYLHELIDQNGLQNQVKIIPSREDVPRLMSAIDLIVFPSFRECFPRTIIEAMAMGKPIVASDVGGISEAVADGVTGLLVRPGDPAQLAESILRILNDRRMSRSMGLLARRRAEELFDNELTSRRIETVYRNIVQKDEAST
jgi:glycosyltransferase involved in cell wall biosynthesis